MTKRKLYTIPYTVGVEGKMETRNYKTMADNETEAITKFNKAFFDDMQKTDLYKVTPLKQVREQELPDLTAKEIKRAVEMFPVSENPIEDYSQVMLKE